MINLFKVIGKLVFSLWVIMFSRSITRQALAVQTLIECMGGTIEGMDIQEEEKTGGKIIVAMWSVDGITINTDKWYVTPKGLLLKRI